MPRSLIIGNGSMLATFDEHLQMRDFYFPHVGKEDHTVYGNVHRAGVWVEGKGFAWFSDDTWTRDIRYKPETLMGNSRLRNEQLGIQLDVQDYVHPVHNVLIRNFSVTSIDGTEKNVRMFFHHDLHIYGDKQKDTAFYEPYTNSVIHYREKRYFLIGGETDNATECNSGVQGGKYQSILRSMEELKTCGISSFAVGKTEYRGLEGTWKDAEDGVLERNPVEQGSVDSTVSIHCKVEPSKPTEVIMWLCAGKTLEDVLHLQQTILEETPERLQRNCHNYWKSWVNKTSHDFGSLGNDLIELYKRSLLIIRMHADNQGGLLAAADADIMAFNRDTYTYVWPRDGAFVSLALDKAGYHEVTRRFFEFCCRVQQPDGYLLHKYNPDESLVSSWHPWFRDGEPQLPIQEDETALVIYAIWKHFESIQDFEFLQEMFERFVKKAADFLTEFRDNETGLPFPSYDPWEEHRGIFTYTTACTIAGLHSASQIAHMLGHHHHSERYHDAADDMLQSLLFHLYDEKKGRFLKKIKRKDGQTIDIDDTPDASLSAVWKLGVLSPTDPRVVSTMKQLEESLKVSTKVGGLARYTNDFYHAVTHPNQEVPGNPWIITTLWDAQWHIACAETKEDLQEPLRILKWVRTFATDTGLLAEQLNPFTGEHLSVSPLTWSHATFVETVLQYLAKEKEIQ